MSQEFIKRRRRCLKTNLPRNYFDFATILNDQGCMLMQAYDNEKGAGTMSPYTFLRAIGP